MSLKCVIVDDQPAIGRFLKRKIQRRYGDIVHVLCFHEPMEALRNLDGEVDLLIMDYEMPQISGRSFLDLAMRRGVPRGNIIILSSHDPDEIRRRIPLGEVLAVINKSDREQQEVLKMIMDAVVKRGRSKRPWPGETG